MRRKSRTETSGFRFQWNSPTESYCASPGAAFGTFFSGSLSQSFAKQMMSRPFDHMIGTVRGEWSGGGVHACAFRAPQSLPARRVTNDVQIILLGLPHHLFQAEVFRRPRLFSADPGAPPSADFQSAGKWRTESASGSAGCTQNSGLSVLDYFRVAANVGGNDRQARREGF